MRKKRKSRNVKLSTDELAKQGESQLTAGRYREAIDTYKQLLKRERRPPWLAALEDAYLARARQLADKGMYREAATLWENMAGFGGSRRHLEHYLEWLIRSGRSIRAAHMFADAEDDIRKSPDGKRVGALLAGLLVSGHQEIAEALPAESPQRRQSQHITEALRAYCQADDAALKEHLKRIPYRSPYRDLRWILLALPEVATDPDTATELLAKVPPESPFAHLAGWVCIACLNEERLLQAICGIAPEARDFVLTLKGWDTTQIKLANQLLARGGKPTSKQALFRLVIANKDAFGVAAARRFCLALLPDCRHGKRDFEKHFTELAPLEWERASALAEERRDNLDAALWHWMQCVQHLKRSATGGDDALKAALILRHMADLSTKLHGPDPWDEELQDFLIHSLQLDPEDSDSYLKLMEMAQQRDDSKAHDRWVEQAVRHFPTDPDIVMAATLAAYRRGAFKKAAGFAHNLLKRDPINRNARNMLLSCHLGHSRKHIKAGKYAMAAKELALATQFAQNDEHHGTLGLTQGFLALLEGSNEGSGGSLPLFENANKSGVDLLKQAYQQLGAGLLAHFRFLVEGRRLQIQQRTLSQHLKRIRPEQQRPATANDILQLAEYTNRYVSDGVDGIADILHELRGPLKAAARLDYAEKELSGICAALERAGQHGLLRHYADAALKRWGQRPIFVYYFVSGRSNGRSDRMTTLDDLQLQTALDNAFDADDHEAIGRIEDFMGPPDFGGTLPFLPPGAPPPDLAGFLDDLENEFEGAIPAELMNALQDAGPEELMNVFENMLRNEGTSVPKLPKRRGR